MWALLLYFPPPVELSSFKLKPPAKAHITKWHKYFMKKAFSVEFTQRRKKWSIKMKSLKGRKLAWKSLEIGSRTAESVSWWVGQESKCNFLKMLPFSSDNFRSSYSHSVASRITNETILFYGCREERDGMASKARSAFPRVVVGMKLNTGARIEACQRCHKLDKTFIGIMLMKWKLSACSFLLGVSHTAFINQSRKQFWALMASHKTCAAIKLL